MSPQVHTVSIWSPVGRAVWRRVEPSGGSRSLGVAPWGSGHTSRTLGVPAAWPAHELKDWTPRNVTLNKHFLAVIAFVRAFYHRHKWDNILKYFRCGHKHTYEVTVGSMCWTRPATSTPNLPLPLTPILFCPHFSSSQPLLSSYRSSFCHNICIS